MFEEYCPFMKEVSKIIGLTIETKEDTSVNNDILETCCVEIFNVRK